MGERETGYRSGQWAAFSAVLDYLNTLEIKVVDKKEIYAAVMKMRPTAEFASQELHVLREAYVAMSIASASDTVQAEYDFSPVLEALRPLIAPAPSKDPSHE